MSEKALCELCGEPMPEGEEMFKYHGYSGNCPKPPKTMPSTQTTMEEKIDQFLEGRCTGAERDAFVGLMKYELSLAVAGERERILQALIEASEPYDGSKWHNTLTIEHIKKVLSTLTP